MGIAPDKPRPDTAYVGTTGSQGVSNVQNESEAKIKAAARKPADDAYASARTNITNNLFGGFLTGIVGFISSLVFALKGVTGGLVDLTGALKATDQKATDAATQANQAIENTSQVVKQVRAVINSITAPFTESWMTQVPGQQVSFPDALLNSAPKRAGTAFSSTTGTVPPWTGQFTVSTSDSKGGSNWYTTYATAYVPEKNVLVAAYIESNYAVGRATITFKVGAVSNPCELYVVACRMLPDGNDEIAWVSPNQTPLMPLGKVEWSATAPQDIPFDELEQMVIGIHQIGTGNVRPLAAIEKDQYARAADSFPPQQAMNFAFSSVLTPGSIIPKNSQQFTTAFLLWIAIGQRLVTGDPLPRSFSDDFEGSFIWTRIGSARAGIRDGRFSYYDSNDLKAFYYYPQPLAYADQRTEAFAYGVNNREQGMMLRGNAAGTSFLALVITSSGAALRQWTSSAQNGYTSLAGYSGSTSGTYWALEAIGDLLTAYQLVDGVWIPRMQVPGAGLLNGRYTGLYTDRSSFANSGEWDNFSTRDMVELQEAA